MLPRETSYRSCHSGLPTHVLPFLILLFIPLMLPFAFPPAGAARAQSASGLPRVVILTDIGGDPDDQQSLVRLLVYSNELEIEGIACSPFSTSVENSVNFAREIIDAYGRVRSNLALHASGYPSASTLESLVKPGQTGLKWTGRGGHEDYRQFIGAGKDTEASELIYEILTDDDPRPVWFCVWGGPVNLAQALWKLTQTHGADDVEAIKEAKVRVHDIYTQDCTVQYFKDVHSDLFYIEDNDVFRGMMRGAEDDESLIEGAWSDAHVRLGHGPLGDLYPSRDGRGVKEGDTPTFLYLLPNGLPGDFEQPTWGSWGGRFQPASTGSRWFTDTEDWSYGDPGVADRGETIYRWREEFQNDFAARMDWCVREYEEANHNPVAAYHGDTSPDVVMLTARPGADIELSAEGSSDPDGNGLSCEWFCYAEAGTYQGDVSIRNADAKEATVSIPHDAEKGDSIHIILRVRDDGEPNLFSYKRIVIAVDPDHVSLRTVTPAASSIRSRSTFARSGGLFDIRGVRIAVSRNDHRARGSISGVPGGIYIVQRTSAGGRLFFTTVNGVGNNQERIDTGEDADQRFSRVQLSGCR